jgi:hypothetical protein
MERTNMLSVIWMDDGADCRLLIVFSSCMYAGHRILCPRSHFKDRLVEELKEETVLPPQPCRTNLPSLTTPFLNL